MCDRYAYRVIFYQNAKIILTYLNAILSNIFGILLQQQINP